MAGNPVARSKAKNGGRSRTFKGILTMIDCGGSQLKLRIERKRGKDIIAQGDLSFLPLAARSLRCQVSVRGRVSRTQTSAKTWRLQMNSLDPTNAPSSDDDKNTKLERILAASQDFWKHKTLEELAEEQGVKPIESVDDLLGGWPGEIDDGFEEWIRAERQSHKPRETL